MACSLSLLNLRFESLSSDIFALGKGDVERLGTDHLAVHVLHSLGGFIGSRVANEAKVLQKKSAANRPGEGLADPRSRVLVFHDFATRDGSESLEFGSQSFIIPLV